MSKYNNIKSIPIESIPKEAIERAIKEWAEGDDAMERLLWTCYNARLKTSGCHAGGHPYIDFKDQEGLDRLGCLFEVTQKTPGSHIFISVDGGNPYSGPEWYLSTILLGLDTMYQDEADPFFDNLSNALENENNSKNDRHVLLDLLEFFKGKESNLRFRFRHKLDNKYEFYIESGEIIDDRYQYYNDLFTGAGMIEEKDEENKLRHSWKISGNELDEVLSRVNDIKNYITERYSLEPPFESSIVSFNQRARYKMKILSEEQFYDWLEEEKQKRIRLEREYKGKEKEKALKSMLDENKDNVETKNPIERK